MLALLALLQAFAHGSDARQAIEECAHASLRNGRPKNVQSQLSGSDCVCACMLVLLQAVAHGMDARRAVVDLRMLAWAAVGIRAMQVMVECAHACLRCFGQLACFGCTTGCSSRMCACMLACEAAGCRL